MSYNPGYQSVLKDLKESTRQRLVALSLTWAPPDDEAKIVEAETGISPQVARQLVALAGSVRAMQVPGLREVASTRTLVTAAHLHAEGIGLPTAARAAIGDALTDDPRLTAALGELIDAWLPAV
jgi:nitric oxide reductase NorQ protein